MSTMSTIFDDVGKVKNPLLDQPVSTIYSWEIWKRKWNRVFSGTPEQQAAQPWQEREIREKASLYLSVEERLGLLHSIFSIKNIDRHEDEERLNLLLDCAWSWRVPSNLYRPNHFGHMENCVETAKLATKAWQILCQNVFKNTARDYELPSWWYLVNCDLLPLVLRFFACGDNWPHSYDTDKNSEHAVNFFRDLFRAVFGDVRFNRDFQRYAITKLLPYKEWILVIVIRNQPQELQWFAESGNWGRLSLRDLAILKHYALNNGRSSKKVATIEEAAVDGSTAAKIFILTKALRREQRRQEKAEEKQQEIKRLQRELAELSR